MFFSILIYSSLTFNEKYIQNVKVLLERINEADAICIGAGAGLSAAGGHEFWYKHDEQFVKEFGELEKIYGFHTAFEGYHYDYKTIEDRWGYLVTLDHLLYELPTTKPYYDLYELVKDKPYHIVTTNQDMQFFGVFPEEKVSEIQGSHGYIQCPTPCHDGVYSNKELVYELIHHVKNGRVPRELIPKCPKCGKCMIPWVRGWTFLEATRYKNEYKKWMKFLEENRNKKILFLELGVGRMTPMFIQHPFWELVLSLPHAYYLTINPHDAILPDILSSKGYAISEDIGIVFHDAVETAKIK